MSLLNIKVKKIEAINDGVATAILSFLPLLDCYCSNSDPWQRSDTCCDPQDNSQVWSRTMGGFSCSTGLIYVHEAEVQDEWSKIV